jgi:hypothetical protein
MSCSSHTNRRFTPISVDIPQFRLLWLFHWGVAKSGLADRPVGHPADHVVGIGCRLVAVKVKQSGLSQDEGSAVKMELRDSAISIMLEREDDNLSLHTVSTGLKSKLSRTTTGALHPA